MKDYIMTDTEIKFAELIWNNEPIGSGELVKLCGQNFNWKKSTTYTVLKKLCLQRIFKNEDSIVTSLVKREEYHQRKSEKFIDDNYGGSLPKFLAAFMSKKELSQKQIKEIKDMIDHYEEEK